MNGYRYSNWTSHAKQVPLGLGELSDAIVANRQFQAIDQLVYGDHGLHDAVEAISEALREKKRVALYADYDVDGTMSCVSWIWFLKALGHDNFLYYIPDRFSEGYGLNLPAIKKLIHEENADVIITMDTGITANVEAAYCREQGVTFVCTDHHKIQPEKMPDCVILNPKQHPDVDYQELCGCGITFVLLRQLAKEFPIDAHVWTDLLALTGMATICDVVPLNGVNHKLAQMGVQALMQSRRPVLQKLLEACRVDGKVDEKDVGFRLGPRINAVGRLEHASLVVEAFVSEEPGQLISKMAECNDRRKRIQTGIVEEAHESLTQISDKDPIVFIGGDWHQGVVGIAASKIAESYWRPTWMFQRTGDLCKGSARSILGFDVTEAMSSCSHLFEKFGGHKAAGGFSFKPENEQAIKEALTSFAEEKRQQDPKIWESEIEFDCELPFSLVGFELLDQLDDFKPFGHGFHEPIFKVMGSVSKIDFYKDKTTGKPKHTALRITDSNGGREFKLLFFNEVIEELKVGDSRSFLVTLSRNTFRGRTSIDLMGIDWETTC